MTRGTVGILRVLNDGAVVRDGQDRRANEPVAVEARRLEDDVVRLPLAGLAAAPEATPRAYERCPRGADQVRAGSLVSLRGRRFPSLGLSPATTLSTLELQSAAFR